MGKFIYLKFLSLFFLWIAACGTETETNSSESTYQTRPSSFVKTQNKPLDAQPETEANQGKSSLLLVSSVEFRGEDEEPEHTIYILEVENLNLSFPTKKGKVHILKDISFKLDTGTTLGVVGESGCGKSMTSLAIMGLIKCE